MKLKCDRLVEEKDEKGRDVEVLKRENVSVERNLFESEGLIGNLKREIEQIVREKNVIATVKSELEVQNCVLKKQAQKKKCLWTLITSATTILTATCIVYIAKCR